MEEYAVHVIFTVDAEDGFEAREIIGELLAASDIDPDNQVTNDYYVLKAEQN